MIPDLIHTRRVFNNNNWQSHGRLYGGRYQQLNEDERSRMTINDEPTTELDIKSCHPTMAYAEVGIDWYGQSNQDIYEKEGVASWPRDLVKRCVSICSTPRANNQLLVPYMTNSGKRGLSKLQAWYLTKAGHLTL